MENICRNCEHFAQRDLDVGRYLSACQKNSGEVVFKWANETCPDFKPRQEKESPAEVDSRED